VTALGWGVGVVERKEWEAHGRSGEGMITGEGGKKRVWTPKRIRKGSAESKESGVSTKTRGCLVTSGNG